MTKVGPTRRWSNASIAGQWLLYAEGWQTSTPTADDPIYYALSGNLDDPAIAEFHPGLRQRENGVSGMNQPDSLAGLADELEAVADKLRADAVDSDEAADLVERCAEMAARIGAEIDARARGAAESEGQERLL